MISRLPTPTVDASSRAAVNGSVWSQQSQNKQLPKLSFGKLTVVDSIQDLIQMKLVTDKRPNPKQRQKMRAKFG